jgi:hypothetical protein
MPPITPQILQHVSLPSIYLIRIPTHRPRHITTPLTQHKHHSSPILLRPTYPTQHILSRPLIRQPPLPRLRTQRRIYMSRAQRIHPDRGPLAPIHLPTPSTPRKRIVRMTPLRSQRARKLMHARFRRIVRRRVDAAIAHVPRHTRDQHDAAGHVGGMHFGGAGAREQECACQVSVEDGAEGRSGVRDGVGFAGYSGAVDEAADGGAEGWAQRSQRVIDTVCGLDGGLEVSRGGVVGAGGGLERGWVWD